MTHYARLRDCSDTIRYFHDVTSALGEKRGAVLFQLPPNFKKDLVLLAEFVNSLPSGMRAAFEFRHESWFADDVYETLKSADAALCIADMEEITTPPVATATFGYLRLRREDYDSADVKRWADVVREKDAGWGDVYIYFKHEEAGIGPRLAAEMKRYECRAGVFDERRNRMFSGRACASHAFRGGPPELNKSLKSAKTRHRRPASAHALAG